MCKFQKQQILDVIQSLHMLHGEIKGSLSGKDYETVQTEDYASNLHYVLSEAVGEKADLWWEQKILGLGSPRMIKY